MAGIFALGLSVVLTPLVLVVLRRFRVLDHPNERSSHDQPVVRGGGIAFGLACVIAVPLSLTDHGLTRVGLGVVTAAVAFGAIGLAEDIWGVPALPRFVLQLVGSSVALVFLLTNLTGGAFWRFVFGLSCLIALTAYANAFNFMDGINGISAVQSFIAGGVWMLLGAMRDIDVLIWGGGILAGASLGFLPYNFPRARLFPGDSGSYFIGGWQAALVIVGVRAGLPPEAAAAPLALYVADTGTTLLRRIAAGEVWHEPHREHVYQRLIRQGWSHVKTTIVVGLFVAACSGLGLLALGAAWARITADAAMAVVLLAYLTLPHLTASRLSGASRTS
jgi:UDP-GlcNAc:undecaprenyl-phosphate/decaprenyl-phosphate GlcNAc-1-phosphate transferase